MVVSVTTHISKLQEFSPQQTDFDAAIRERLKVRFDGQPFAPRKSHIAFNKANDLLTWQAEYSGAASRIEVLAPLYPEDWSSQFTIAVFEKGRVAQQAILSAAQPRFDSEESRHGSTPRAALVSIIGSFGQQGILHIFGGLDHVCFVLGLLLLGGSLRALLKIITAFTFAHSITLTLAALGIYAPSPRVIEPIEPLIALSIIAVAAENFRHHHARKNAAAAKTDWRSLLTFGFGLIHGFGFAGALGEVGLPREALGWALASFNVGVEIGQAAIILLIAPALAWLARKSKLAHRRLVLTGSAGIACAGLFWFMQRLI